MNKLDELLAELNEEIINYGAAPVTQREYDLLSSALRERAGMVLVPRKPDYETLCAIAAAARISMEKAHQVHRILLTAAEGK